MSSLSRLRPTSPLRRSARLLSKQEAHSSHKRDRSPIEPHLSVKKQKGSDTEPIDSKEGGIESKSSIKRKSTSSPSKEAVKQTAKQGSASKKGAKSAKSSNKRYNGVC